MLPNWCFDLNKEFRKGFQLVPKALRSDSLPSEAKAFSPRQGRLPGSQNIRLCRFSQLHGSKRGRRARRTVRAGKFNLVRQGPLGVHIRDRAHVARHYPIRGDIHCGNNRLQQLKCLHFRASLPGDTGTTITRSIPASFL
jgi:hypothetical protein